MSAVSTRNPKAANLKLSLTGPATAKPDKGVKYKTAIQNLGPAAAGSVQLEVVLPEGAGFVGAASDGRCGLGAGVTHCTLGDLKARKTRRLTIGLIYGKAGRFAVRAEASAWNGDPKPANNKRSVGTRVR